MLRFTSILITIVIISSFINSCKDNNQPNSYGNAKDTILIGGLFSLTGNLQSLGQSSKAAMELSIDKANAQLVSNKSSLFLKAVYEDTMLEPDSAKSKFVKLYNMGVRVFIGPSSSSEVNAVKRLTDSLGAIVISHYSTAGSLAIQGDNIFRFCPSDILECPAVAALMKKENIKAVIPFWRDDAGNNGLHDRLTDALSTYGIEYYTGVLYSPNDTNFKNALSRLKLQIQQAINKYGANSVAVYNAGFDEFTEIFTEAYPDTVFSFVKWYGGDGLTQNDKLFTNPNATEFAVKVGTASPIIARDKASQAIWQPIVDQIKSKTSVEANFYALAVYDAVQVVALTFSDFNSIVFDVSAFKTKFVIKADSYSGVTSSTALNEAGDRKYGSFDFWSVKNPGNIPQWVQYAYFDGISGIVTYY